MAQRMKAWVVDRPGPVDDSPVVPVDRDVPDPGPGQVRVRVRVCGVCRTDLHLAEGDLAPRRRRVTPGHEIVGVVDHLGPGSTRWREGDRDRGAMARPHLRDVPVLHLGPREPVHGSAVHGLGPRRRVRRVRRRGRGLRLRPSRRVRRCGGGATALCGDHRLPGAAAGQSPRGGTPRHLRLRRLGAHHGAGRAGPRRPRPRHDAVTRGASPGARARGGQRRRGRGRAARASRLRHPVRPGRRPRACRPWLRSTAAGRWPSPASISATSRLSTTSASLRGADTAERDGQHPRRRRGVPRRGRPHRRPGVGTPYPMAHADAGAARPPATTGSTGPPCWWHDPLGRLRPLDQGRQALDSAGSCDCRKAPTVPQPIDVKALSQGPWR